MRACVKKERKWGGRKRKEGRKRRREKEGERERGEEREQLYSSVGWLPRSLRTDPMNGKYTPHTPMPSPVTVIPKVFTGSVLYEHTLAAKYTTPNGILAPSSLLTLPTTGPPAILSSLLLSFLSKPNSTFKECLRVQLPHDSMWTVPHEA